MEIKKIIFTFKSWYITPLESDTILGYIFAMNFNTLKDVFDDFQKWESPFLITNAFEDGYLPRPSYFTNNEQLLPTLEKDIKDEKDRKKLKKSLWLPLDKKALELCFLNKNKQQQNEFKKYLISNENNDKEENKKVSEFKNNIPRFHKWETNPYTIENVKWDKRSFIIYVKILDEDKWNKFYASMKTIFTTIWWGKWKSRWYGKIDKIEVETLTTEEKEVFDYIEEMKNNGRYYILNNYKPSNEELKVINLEESFIEYNHKNGKTLQNMPFKWQFSFIKAGSVVQSDNKLIWDKYVFENENNKSVNFGYLF